MLYLYCLVFRLTFEMKRIFIKLFIKLLIVLLSCRIVYALLTFYDTSTVVCNEWVLRNLGPGPQYTIVVICCMRMGIPMARVEHT